MFMFRSKRNSLTRRLLRARRINETLRENEELLRTHIISKLLDPQLETLVGIIENKIDNRTCIPIPRYTNNKPSSSNNTIIVNNSSRKDCATTNFCRNSDDNGDTSTGDCFMCCVSNNTSSTISSSTPPFCGATSTSSPSSLLETNIQQTPPPPPHFLCCQTYRWPELKNFNELKKLPHCNCDNSNNDDEDMYICCNPYHWSKLCGPESPPPPYRRYPEEKLRPEDRAPSEGKLPQSVSTSVASSNSSLCSTRRTNQGSLPTSGDGGAGRGSSAGEWCKLAYWELQRRVGVLFPVKSSTVHVFSSPAQPGSADASLCLEGLARSSTSQGGPPSQSVADAIRRTCSKIGLGVMLSQEADGVWAYNLSEGPLFVNSPTLDEPHSRTLVVYKLPPGCCLRIFDWERASRRRPTIDPTCGPVDPHSVRISFAKGWGPKYSRQEVTSCPCWLEVLLAPPPPPR